MPLVLSLRASLPSPSQVIVSPSEMSYLCRYSNMWKDQRIIMSSNKLKLGAVNRGLNMPFNFKEALGRNPYARHLH